MAAADWSSAPRRPSADLQTLFASTQQKGNGGAVNVSLDNQAWLGSNGDGAVGILAQSIGGGGGVIGGMSKIDLAAAVQNTPVAEGGQGGNVTVSLNDIANIVTHGTRAHGIVAQSLGRRRRRDCAGRRQWLRLLRLDALQRLQRRRMHRRGHGEPVDRRAGPGDRSAVVRDRRAEPRQRGQRRDGQHQPQRLGRELAGRGRGDLHERRGDEHHQQPTARSTTAPTPIPPTARARPASRSPATGRSSSTTTTAA